jgi:hypothetical protein
MPLTIAVGTIVAGGVSTVTGGQKGLGTSATTTIITDGQYTVRATRQCGLGHDSTFPWHCWYLCTRSRDWPGSCPAVFMALFSGMYRELPCHHPYGLCNYSWVVGILSPLSLHFFTPDWSQSLQTVISFASIWQKYFGQPVCATHYHHFLSL